MFQGFAGIHHEKVGIFTDEDGDSLSFSGSVNETWSGWTANSEEFKVFDHGMILQNISTMT